MNLRDALRASPNRRMFNADVAFANTLSGISEHMNLSAADVIQALTTQIVSVVQSRAMPSEWADASNAITDEIKRRLLVRQD